MSPSENRASSDLLPLRPVDLQILMVLAAGDLHGYGLMKEVERQSGGKVTLEVGSLYRVLGRLLDQGMIGDDGEAEDDDPRRGRVYRITSRGLEVARAETERLADLVATARTRLTPGGVRR